MKWDALAVAVVAGLFSLLPLMWQISTTRAQRRDRMTRLSHLRAELELLERLHTLQGEVRAGDEAAKRELDLTINNSLSYVMGQYNALSEIAPSKIAPSTKSAPSTVGGGEQPAPRHLSFLRSALLLYDPNTALGWILHTVFYIFAIILGTWSLMVITFVGFDPLAWAVFATPLVIGLLIIRYLARRNAAPLEETASCPTEFPRFWGTPLRRVPLSSMLLTSKMWNLQAVG
jgi:hypothetical protein